MFYASIYCMCSQPLCTSVQLYMHHYMNVSTLGWTRCWRHLNIPLSTVAPAPHSRALPATDELLPWDHCELPGRPPLDTPRKAMVCASKDPTDL